MLLSVVGIISAVATVVGALSNLGLAIQGLITIGNAILGLAKTLGLLKVDNVEELGDRALQAEQADVTPEKFDSYKAYVEAVESEEGYRYDPEKTKDIPVEEKIRKGTELSVGVTIEEFPALEVFFEHIDSYPELFTEKSLSVLAEIILKNEGCLTAIDQYLRGEAVDGKMIENAVDALVLMEQAENPTISENEAIAKALSMRG